MVTVLERKLDAEIPFELCKDDRGRLFTRTIRKQDEVEAQVEEPVVAEEPVKKKKKFDF